MRRRWRAGLARGSAEHRRLRHVPLGTRAAIWLCGDGAALRSLDILGTPQASTGILVQSGEAPLPPPWVRGCRVEDCLVADLEGKQDEIAAVRLVCLSTGHGSITHNHIAGNRAAGERAARFGAGAARPGG